MNNNKQYFLSHLLFAFLISNIASSFIVLIVIPKYIKCDGESSLATVRRCNRGRNIWKEVKTSS